MVGLRKLHRIVGPIIVPLVLLQVVGGVLLRLDVRTPFFYKLHTWFKYGPRGLAVLGVVVAIVLGLGLAVQAVSGTAMYLGMRIQQWKRRAKAKATASPKPPPKAPKAGMSKPAELAMTDTEKAEFVAANCICATCPSYLKEECEKAGEFGSYCLLGKSKVITKENFCVCPQCPVTAKMALKWGYYCTSGSAKEMMAMETQGGGGK